MCMKKEYKIYDNIGNLIEIGSTVVFANDGAVEIGRVSGFSGRSSLSIDYHNGYRKAKIKALKLKCQALNTEAKRALWNRETEFVTNRILVYEI